MHYAAEVGSIEHLKLLLAHGADPDVRNSQKGEGFTPLYLAFHNLVPTQRGVARIHASSREEYKKCIRELVRRGANPNSVDHNGMPPCDPDRPFDLNDVRTFNPNYGQSWSKRFAGKFL